MYADLGPGQMIDLDPPSPDGMDVLYSHEYVAKRMRSRSLEERGNLYGYVRNNPVNYVDPSGLIAFDDTSCWIAAPTVSIAGCAVHEGTRFYTFDAACVCRCAGTSPWDNFVRGCLHCAEVAGVPSNEAHDRCYAIADKIYGKRSGLAARLYIGLWCRDCMKCGNKEYWELPPVVHGAFG